MIIIGCDLHTRFQQIAMLDTETGEIVERRLEHGTGEAQHFYAALPAPARVGIEATGYARWLERMLREQGHELWIGDASAIRAARVRQQKTDARDAQHLLHLLVENRFPRIWVSSPAERDVWQLLRHRHKLVGFRTSVRNQLHALAMGEGVCRKQKLWSERGRPELQALPLGEWAGRALSEQSQAGELSGTESQRGQQRRQTAPGSDPQTRQLAGLRFLLVEAAQTAARSDPELRRAYQRWVHRRGRAVVPQCGMAIARKWAVRLYWKLREPAAQPMPPTRMQGSPPRPVLHLVYISWSF